VAFASENPARWRGHLDQLLPERAKVQQVVHHPALPYDQMPDFMTALRAQGRRRRLGLEFQILTAARTGEVIGARWDEFDEHKRLWTVPAARMKAGREHRVALPTPAIAILAAQRTVSQSEFVFPGLRPGQPLSNMAFLQLLRRMRRTDLTAHGFRSTFREWAAKQTGYAREVVEMALAHTISDKVEAAYRRGDLFEKRCQLMEDWARHCTAPAGGRGLRVIARTAST
jgi:integrase